MDAAKAAFEAAKALFGPSIEAVRNLEREQIPFWAQETIRLNPGLTAAQLLLIVFFAMGFAVASPVFTLLGFTTTGPGAASWAALFQSAFGSPAVFSTLQSAAMGGYGVAIVGGVVKALAMVRSAALWVFGQVTGVNVTDAAA